MKVRASLVLTHCGPYTLEEATQDYINQHSDLKYDLPGMVSVSNEKFGAPDKGKILGRSVVDFYKKSTTLLPNIFDVLTYYL